MANEWSAGSSNLGKQWARVEEASAIIQAKVPGAIAALNAGSVDKAWIYSLVASINKILVIIDGLIAQSPEFRADLQAYGRIQKREPTFDLTASGLAIRTAAININDAIASGFPKDNDGYLLAEQLVRNTEALGSLTIAPRQIANATQRAALSGLLQTLLDLTTA